MLSSNICHVLFYCEGVIDSLYSILSDTSHAKTLCHDPVSSRFIVEGPLIIMKSSYVAIGLVRQMKWTYVLSESVNPSIGVLYKRNTNSFFLSA